jgi:23S rRNA (cytidine1920-2'-O)/16S rRNA (cytidine1409-2'-O)-methyltransferase
MPYHRADQLLVAQGLANTRSQATRLIKEGAVYALIDGHQRPITKPSMKLDDSTQLQVTDQNCLRYVSRGALKLEKALTLLPSVKGQTALDVGQSTGGFTDCLLQAGAAKVVGVDVGHDQLAKSLLADDRVICLEGINARDLPAEQLLEYSPQGYDLAVMDVSFISQTLILPGLVTLIKPGGWLVSLVKPQFEVGRDGVGKGGIVRDASLYALVKKNLTGQLQQLGLTTQHFIDSPITGGDGNREFLMLAHK